MTEPTKKPEVVELFIGRFEIVDTNTNGPTGDVGYVGLLLGAERVAQFRTPYYPALRPLIDELKQNGYWLTAARNKITFEPAKRYQHEAKDRDVVTTALTLDEIDRVEVALGRY